MNKIEKLSHLEKNIAKNPDFGKKQKQISAFSLTNQKLILLSTYNKLR